MAARRKKPDAAPAGLDQVLPRAEPGGVEVHRGAALLETAEPAQLAGLAADPALGRYLLCRLSDTVALVDPGEADRLVEALRKAGHTPKCITGKAAGRGR